MTPDPITISFWGSSFSLYSWVQLRMRFPSVFVFGSCLGCAPTAISMASEVIFCLLVGVVISVWFLEISFACPVIIFTPFLVKSFVMSADWFLVSVVMRWLIFCKERLVSLLFGE